MAVVEGYAVQAIGHDELDALEARIEAQAAGVRQQALPRASLAAPEVARLKRERELLNGFCATTREALQRLARDHELTRLHLNFEPLLQRLRLYDEALRISDELAALLARLEREIAEVKEASVALAKQFLPTHLPRFEQGLESFQDRCDSVADQLDALEAAQQDISGLLPVYEQWLAWVERFGEILDERSEALRLPQA